MVAIEVTGKYLRVAWKDNLNYLFITQAGRQEFTPGGSESKRQAALCEPSGGLGSSAPEKLYILKYYKKN